MRTTVNRGRVASLVLLLVVCGAYLVHGRGPVDPTGADQNIGRFALEHQWHGDSYYVAMEKSLDRVNGPANSGRAFREPMIFELWRLLGSEDAIWVAFVVLVAAVGVASALTSDAPLAAPIVALYLFKTAALDQHLLVEVWAAPILLLAVAAWRKAWYRTAAALTVVATFTRELALLVTLGGGWSRQRDVKPWIAAAVTGVVGVGAHFAYAGRYTSPSGSEAPLFGTGSPDVMLRMVGVGFAHPVAFALILWPLALWRLAQDRELARFLGPLMAFPLIGLSIGRLYWGFLFVPVMLLLAVERATSLVRAGLAADGRSPRLQWRTMG